MSFEEIMKKFKQFEEVKIKENEEKQLKQHFRDDDFSSFCKFLLDNVRQKKDYLVDFIKFCNNSVVFNSYWLDEEIKLNHELPENRIIPRKKELFEEALALKLEFRNFTNEEKELLHYYNVAKRTIRKEEWESWYRQMEEERYYLTGRDEPYWLIEEREMMEQYYEELEQEQEGDIK